MAENDKKSTKYYRSDIARLEVIYNGKDSVQFEAYEEKWEGEKVYVGYLATDVAAAQAQLEQDPNAEEIDKSLFDKKTGEKSKRATV